MADPLFRALARPQMVAGVTYPFFVMNGIVAAELFLIFKTPLALLPAPIRTRATTLSVRISRRPVLSAGGSVTAIGLNIAPTSQPFTQLPQ